MACGSKPFVLAVMPRSLLPESSLVNNLCAGWLWYHDFGCLCRSSLTINVQMGWKFVAKDELCCSLEVLTLTKGAAAVPHSDESSSNALWRACSSLQGCWSKKIFQVFSRSRVCEEQGTVVTHSHHLRSAFQSKNQLHRLVSIPKSCGLMMSLAGIIVLNAELQSMNSILT